MRLWYLSQRRPAKAQASRASAQSHQSLRCSHTWNMEVDEGFDQKIRHLAPLDGCACAFDCFKNTLFSTEFDQNKIWSRPLRLCLYYDQCHSSIIKKEYKEKISRAYHKKKKKKKKKECSPSPGTKMQSSKAWNLKTWTHTSRQTAEQPSD